MWRVCACACVSDVCLNGSRFSHYFIIICLSDNRNSKIYQYKTVLLRIWLHQITVCGHREANYYYRNVIINNKCIFGMFRSPLNNVNRLN